MGRALDADAVCRALGALADDDGAAGADKVTLLPRLLRAVAHLSAVSSAAVSASSSASASSPSRRQSIADGSSSSRPASASFSGGALSGLSVAPAASSADVRRVVQQLTDSMPGLLWGSASDAAASAGATPLTLDAGVLSAAAARAASSENLVSALGAGAAAVASPPRSGKQPRPRDEANSPCAFEMSSDEEEYVLLLCSFLFIYCLVAIPPPHFEYFRPHSRLICVFCLLPLSPPSISHCSDDEQLASSLALAAAFTVRDSSSLWFNASEAALSALVSPTSVALALGGKEEFEYSADGDVLDAAAAAADAAIADASAAGVR
jgi:hypothetical protein